MKDKPVIGITASRNKSMIAWLFDWLAVKRAGGFPVRVRPGDDIDPDRLEGLVIGGGDDIGAELYNGELTMDVRIDPERDELEKRLLAHAFERRTPVLGICRGSQMINIQLGGTLHADIYETFEGVRRLRTALPRKMVSVDPQSRLGHLLGCVDCPVNSLHHQAVDKLGTGLRIVARDAHGIVQATEDPDHPFLIGVQWHPEFLVLDQGQQRLFRTLVETVSNARKGAREAAGARN